MGMDVYGKKEDTYFRANVWSWRPLVAIMQAAGHDVPRSWNYNDGDGLTTAAECEALSDKITEYLSKHDDDVFKMPIDNETFEIFKSNPYSIRREHVIEWCDFLDTCEGFQIF